METSPRLLIETLGDAGLRYRWRSPGKRLGTWVGLLSKVAVSGFAAFTKATDQQIADAIRFGQALAAWNCRFEGARGGMYAVSRKQFQEQIDEILSGSGRVIPLSTGAALETPDASGVCRVCKHSASRVRSKHSKAK